MRVHVHTPTPTEAIATARAFGAVSHEKIDDMETQFRALASTPDSPSTPADGVAVVAIGAGAGIIDLFESMGASVVPGGQTMNPSAGDITAAIEATGATSVIVLPNNKNVIMAAKLAAQQVSHIDVRRTDVRRTDVRVIETRSVPQGVAALVAYNSEAPLEENADAMTEAVAAVRTGEVTLAARDTSLHGIDIRSGQPIALIDGDIALASQTIDEAVRACVASMLQSGDVSAIVTLYTGADTTPGAAEALAATIRAAHGVEVEVVAGGQPHYPYLIGVE